MFGNILNFFKKYGKREQLEEQSKNTAKERLHLVLMQDRANVSADFLDMMKQEIIDVIKKYIDVEEKDIDVRLTNKTNEDGTTGAPALYANIPIAGIKEEMKKDKDAEDTKEIIKAEILNKIGNIESKIEKSNKEEVVEENEEIEEIKDKEEIIEATDDEEEIDKNLEDDEKNKKIKKTTKTKKQTVSKTKKAKEKANIN